MRDNLGKRCDPATYARLREHGAAISRAEWRRRCRAHTSIARMLLVCLGVLALGYGWLQLGLSALVLMHAQGPQGFALLPAPLGTLSVLLLLGGTLLGLPFLWDRLAMRGGRRSAALTMGRCASCGYPLAAPTDDSASKHRTCSECGSMWKIPVDAVTRFRHVGWVTDHRKDQHRFRYEAPRPLPFFGKRNLRAAMLSSGGCAAAGMLFLVLMNWMGDLDEVGPQLRGWQETLLLGGLASSYLLLVLLLTIPVATNAGQRARIKQVDEVLAAGKCPVCSQCLPTGAVEADGCTVCPECGSAWRLPEPSDA